MGEVFIGSKQLAQGAVTRGQLRWNFQSILPDVYARKGTVPALQTRIGGAWLWSGGYPLTLR
jgi:hypothetical protein